MKADYALAAKDLAVEGNKAGYLAAVDATQHRQLAAQFSVRGFPTLLYFVDGRKEAEYDRKRTRADLVSYVNDKFFRKTEL